MMTQEEIIKKYLGTAYSHRGRKKETGLDCYGLIICIYKDLGLDLLDLIEYEIDWSKNGKNYFIDNYADQWEKVVVNHVYDVVLFRNYLGIANHAGVVLTQNRFIHCCKAGCVIQKLSDPTWKNRIVGFYRHKNLMEMFYQDILKRK